MKNTHILLAAMLLIAATTSSYAQWSTSGASTTGNVGIGTTTIPNNAWLHIYGEPFYMCSNAHGVNMNPYYPKPEIWIDRQLVHSSTLACGTPPPFANYFQIGYTSGTSSTILDVINPSGYLGILQARPTQPLDVNGNALIEQNLTVNQNGSIGNNLTVTNTGTMGALSVTHNATVGNDLTVTNTATVRTLTVTTNAQVDNDLKVLNTATVGTLNVTTNASVSNNLTVTNSGTMGTLTVTTNAMVNQILTVNNYAVIGTSGGSGSPLPVPSVGETPGVAYSLYVANGILTEKLKVANSTDANWSDFVFKSNYKLMSLNDLAAYVKTNKHLPEIPSASDVQKEGIDIANMDAKLLQKIEELTLYVIQQQKEIEELKKQISY